MNTKSMKLVGLSILLSLLPLNLQAQDRVTYHVALSAKDAAALHLSSFARVDLEKKVTDKNLIRIQSLSRLAFWTVGTVGVVKGLNHLSGLKNNLINPAIYFAFILLLGPLEAVKSKIVEKGYIHFSKVDQNNLILAWKQIQKNGDEACRKMDGETHLDIKRSIIVPLHVKLNDLESGRYELFFSGNPVFPRRFRRNISPELSSVYFSAPAVRTSIGLMINRSIILFTFLPFLIVFCHQASAEVKPDLQKTHFVALSARQSREVSVPHYPQAYASFLKQKERIPALHDFENNVIIALDYSIFFYSTFQGRRSLTPLSILGNGIYHAALAEVFLFQPIRTLNRYLIPEILYRNAKIDPTNVEMATELVIKNGNEACQFQGEKSRIALEKSRVSHLFVTREDIESKVIRLIFEGEEVQPWELDQMSSGTRPHFVFQKLVCVPGDSDT